MISITWQNNLLDMRSSIHSVFYLKSVRPGTPTLATAFNSGRQLKALNTIRVTIILRRNMTVSKESALSI